MPKIKTLLLLILCLAIPLQGFAALAALGPPCSMEAMAGGSMDHSMADDCCNDADTVAKTGKLCKMGQECHSSTQGPLFTLNIHLPSPPHSVRFALVELPVHSLDPAGLWRPPTQL